MKSNKEALEFLENYRLTDPENVDEITGKPYFKNLQSMFREIYEENISEEIDSQSRWWNNLFCVIKLNDKLIGYGWASTTDDNHSIFDLGWEFDESSVCFVEPKQVITTIYDPI